MFIYRGKKINVPDNVLVNLYRNTGIPISEKLFDTLISNDTGIYPSDKAFSEITAERIEEIIKEAARPVNKNVFG